MTDTPQSLGTGESVVASDPITDAANAFKVQLGQVEAVERPRDDRGRFAPTQEIEAEEEVAEAAEPEAESHDEEITDEAAEEAQPEPVDLPTSWPAEQAEAWNSLPPETQAFIREREGQREAAVNAKFQEAANVKKANEALITEANTNRQKFAEAADMVLSMVQPQKPPLSMLNPQSADYNPDGYHLANAQYEQTAEWLSNLQQQRQHIAAQQQQEETQAEQAYIQQVEDKFRPALLKDVPALADPSKQGPALSELINYAISQGIGEHVFKDPEIANRITSPELHMAWKAMKYDQMMKAKGNVQPKAQKPAAPPVKPGVATPRSAVAAANYKKASDRLAASGSVEDGAAIWKNFL